MAQANITYNNCFFGFYTCYFFSPAIIWLCRLTLNKSMAAVLSYYFIFLNVLLFFRKKE